MTRGGGALEPLSFSASLFYAAARLRFHTAKPKAELEMTHPYVR